MTSQAAFEAIATAREKAILILTGLRDDTRRELMMLNVSPELKQRSPKHVARLETLLSALHMALDDMHAAQAAEAGNG